VVPLDGSELAEETLPVAERFAITTGVPLHLIRVVNRAAILIGREAGFREANDYLSSTVRTLRRKGIAATSDVRFGPVAASLRDAIEPNDLVVMATRGRGGLRRWLLGSVAERLVEWSSAPIVLVRAGTTAGRVHAALPPRPAHPARSAGVGRP
jgi:nucleotide-binding universal stress UspA family protein